VVARGRLSDEGSGFSEMVVVNSICLEYNHELNYGVLAKFNAVELKGRYLSELNGIVSRSF
jgi:hypothetical protein